MNIATNAFLLNLDERDAIEQKLFTQFHRTNTALSQARTVEDFFTAWDFTFAVHKNKLTVQGHNGNGAFLELFFILLAPYVQEGSKLTLDDEAGPMEFTFHQGECNIEYFL